MSSTDTTSELRHELQHERLIELLLPAFKASGLDVKEMDKVIAEIERMLAAQKQRWEAEARKDELEYFNSMRLQITAEAKDDELAGDIVKRFGYKASENIVSRLAALDGVIGPLQGDSK